MAKNVIFVGYNVPGHTDLYAEYSSDRSLLDADLVVFEPNLTGYSHDTAHQGKTTLSEDDSFRFREDSVHWRKELQIALAAGKTIVVFFSRYEEIFIHTGQKDYSGTGRNQRVTNMVELSNNYQFLPIGLPKIIPKGGSRIVSTGHAAVAPYWKQFQKDSRYESYLDDHIKTPLFHVETARKPVGGLFRVGRGTLVLLPPPRYDEDEFTDESGENWTKAGTNWGSRLISALVLMAEALEKDWERTPPPAWSTSDEYLLKTEQALTTEMAEVDAKVSALLLRRKEADNQLAVERQLKELLYGKGKALEIAILKGMAILGYEASGYKDEHSEFDSIILSPEGDRFIGEAEGRDNAGVGIEKFRQLHLNIQEDLEREEVTAPAVGILFGNGFRLEKPADREETFTLKCLKSAAQIGIILMRTSDLFTVVRYVRDSGDRGFAEQCRNVIRESRGKIVAFPAPPFSG